MLEVTINTGKALCNYFNWLLVANTIFFSGGGNHSKNYFNCSLMQWHWWKKEPWWFKSWIIIWKWWKLWNHIVIFISQFGWSVYLSYSPLSNTSFEFENKPILYKLWNLNWWLLYWWVSYPVVSQLLRLWETGKNNKI